MFFKTFLADRQPVHTHSLRCTYLINGSKCISCLYHNPELFYIDQGKEQIALSPRYPREFQYSNDEMKTGFDSNVKWNAPRTY